MLLLLLPLPRSCALGAGKRWAQARERRNHLAPPRIRCLRSGCSPRAPFSRPAGALRVAYGGCPVVWLNRGLWRRAPKLRPTIRAPNSCSLHELTSTKSWTSNSAPLERLVLALAPGVQWEWECVCVSSAFVDSGRLAGRPAGRLAACLPARLAPKNLRRRRARAALGTGRPPLSARRFQHRRARSSSIT